MSIGVSILSSILLNNTLFLGPNLSATPISQLLSVDPIQDQLHYPYNTERITLIDQE
jgi:hypothetical protein